MVVTYNEEQPFRKGYVDTFDKEFLCAWQPFLPREKIDIYAFKFLVRPFHEDVLDTMQTFFGSFKFKDQTRQQGFVLRPCNFQIDKIQCKSEVVLRFDIVLDPAKWLPLPVETLHIYGTLVASVVVDEITSSASVCTTIVSFPYRRHPLIYI
jgi:hypothetical protein